MTAKKKITDKNGVQVFPITHTKAVLDDNGNSVEQRLQENLDLINQKQLEVGAVPSDITPTAGSTNWVTSGGLYERFKNFEDVIGIYKEIETSWVVGVIDSTSGQNVSSHTRIRSGFINMPKGKILVSCEDGYTVLGILAYNSATLSDYHGILYWSYDINSSVKVTTDADYQIRVVVAKEDGSNMVVADGDNVSIFISDTTEESIIDNLNEQESEIDILHNMVIGSDEVALTLHKGGYWNIDHIFRAVDGYSYSDPLLVYEGQQVKVTVNVGAAANGVWGSPTKDGAAGVALIGADTEVIDRTITIPSGVSYIFISSRNEDFSPAFTPSAYTTQGWIIDKIKEEIDNPFMGLKFVALGDSITQGQVASGTAPAKPFPVLVAEELGMNLVNYGIGGSTIGTCANYGGTFANIEDFNAATKDTSKYYVVMTGRQTYADYRYDGSSWVTTSIAMRTPLVGRYDLMDNDADIILVAGGTNDFQYNWAEIGEITDNVSTTFRGALNNLCNGLITKYPQKCIIFMTPIKRCQTQQAAAANSDTTAHRGGSYGTIDSQNNFGKTLKDYGDIIKEICARYSIPVIDMYAESMLNPQLSAQSSLFDSYKTHPFQAGHNLMARLIVGKLKSIFGMDI